ncbi:exodeoxyribonuclease V subunit alpha [Lysobacter sp. A289]
MSYRFESLPAESAVEAWRPLDRALYRWVIGHGGSPLLAKVAAWASLADGNGHTALRLSDGVDGDNAMPALSQDEITALANQPMVGKPDADAAAPVPFVLDADGRFYLWRNHQHEIAVVDAVNHRRGNARAVEVAEADIDALFHGINDDTVTLQRHAVRSVVGRKLFVLTGGPGTGKTTTVLRMLLMLMLMLQRQSPTPLAIQVAAPTGKAAQRLVQSLRKGKQNLLQHPAKPLPQEWHPLLENVPDHEALTLHRLLGYRPYDNVFARNAKDPIPADVVVVDEASMVDLAMLRSLLDAVRPDATLILVGDADQLTSVAAGSVLMDLVSAMSVENDGAGAGDLVKLQHSFRAEQYLVDINQAINGGDAERLSEAVAAAGTHATRIAVDDLKALGNQIDRWAEQIGKGSTDQFAFDRHSRVGGSPGTLPINGLKSMDPRLRGDDDNFSDLPKATALRAPTDSVVDPAEPTTTPADTGPVEAALDALAQRQLLCALREGPYGAIAVNLAIEQRLRRHWKIERDREWYPGRAVIVIRNDYTAGLFNGDVGICLADAEGHLRVWFEGSPGRSTDGEDAGFTRTLRSFAPNALPPHESAFAITIHKSQGSEYAHVAVLLPPDAESRILSRQLLYTGVSRAKVSVELWAADDALATAVTHTVQRQGGVAAKLAPTTRHPQ